MRPVAIAVSLLVLISLTGIREAYGAELSNAQLVDIFKRADQTAQVQAGTNALAYVNLFRFEANNLVNSLLGREPAGLDLWTNNLLLAHAQIHIPEALRGLGIADEDTNHVFPACVALGSLKTWGGSGVLIASNLVLTAAHCVDKGFTNFVAFGLAVTNPATRAVYRVAAAKQHRDYNRSTKENDLAVLWLASDVDRVLPARFATHAQITNSGTIRAVGFGFVDRMATRGAGIRRWANINIESYDCQGLDTNALRKFGCYKDEIVARQIVDTCQGDSGGPAYVNVGTTNQPVWLLAAITSRGIAQQTTRCGDGGVYRRVDGERPFFDSLTNVHWARK